MASWLASKAVLHAWRAFAARTPILYELEECVLAPHSHCVVDLAKSGVLLLVLLYLAFRCRYTIIQLAAVASVWWLFQTELVCVWYIGDAGTSPYFG